MRRAIGSVFTPSTKLAAAVLSVLVGGCFLERSASVVAPTLCDDCRPCVAGEDCVGGRCRAGGVDGGLDAGGRSDSGVPDAGNDAGNVDAHVDIDAGPPAHCSDGMLNQDETDIDCGGSCHGCWMCARCVRDADCTTGPCSSGRCEPVTQDVPGVDGMSTPAFVREDGAILLAHYAPGTWHSAYDPALYQQTTTTGGVDRPTGWAPDPCAESGHVDMTRFDPSARVVRMECGTSLENIEESVFSDSMFSGFHSGTRGTVGAVGTPGWGAIASHDSLQARASQAMCGLYNYVTAPAGGIAYCSGTGGPSSYANHLVSYGSYNDPAVPGVYAGCGGRGCIGTSCDIEVWVWLE